MNSHTITRALVTTTMVIGMVLSGLAARGMANPLPPEPGTDSLVRENVDYVVGLYFREYSVADNGVVDYRTARQILFTRYGDPDAPVLDTKVFPLFYWYDSDQDGQFEMWVDRKVEGCACDIVRYGPHPLP